MANLCVLCDGRQLLPLQLQTRPGVRYWHCQDCDLIFIDRADLLSSADEKARYENHENVEGNVGYEKFLGQLWQPMRKYLKPSASGIDFGCGPGPALQKMIEREGFACAIYDPFYVKDEKVLSQTYDFVTSTEVVEHFNHPAKSWDILLALVRTGGVIGVMTQFHSGCSQTAEFFAKWWYARDPAHVSFYSEKTLRWIFARAGFEILKIASPVVIARRS